MGIWSLTVAHAYQCVHVREAVIDHFGRILQVFLLHLARFGVEMTKNEMNLCMALHNKRTSGGITQPTNQEPFCCNLGHAIHSSGQRMHLVETRVLAVIGTKHDGVAGRITETEGFKWLLLVVRQQFDVTTAACIVLIEAQIVSAGARKGTLIVMISSRAVDIRAWINSPGITCTLSLSPSSSSPSTHRN